MLIWRRIKLLIHYPLLLRMNKFSLKVKGQYGLSKDKNERKKKTTVFPVKEASRSICKALHNNHEKENQLSMRTEHALNPSIGELR